ncbi:carbohydrate sulfotransferase 4-like [Ylistrum balloti]|uniref:carbohydrate sulfotransferase 4-like n=1 Tax=Ylistrum balloti TaxID=509963 RepID=UPI002905BE79|nr:carbohydrate sulfotransferase 4-like [Ylistrum balloti]
MSLCFHVYFSNQKDSGKIEFLGKGMDRFLSYPLRTTSHVERLRKQVKKNHHILLIGYLGGGTSLLGDILGTRNTSFYLYEPLHYMARFGYFKPGYQCSMKTGNCWKNNQTSDQAIRTVQAIFNCDYDHYNHTVQWWQVRLSGAAGKVNDRNWNISSSRCNRTCLMKYLKLCSHYDSIVSKIPRVSVSLASQLLNKFSNLNIIHLLRDPRAIMNSRNKYDWTPVPGGAIALCNKMADDFLESVKLKRVYPGRFYTVFYEDMVTDPFETFKYIYTFAGYNFNADEQLRINKKTRNSQNIAWGWRNIIDHNVLKETNKACSHLYSLLGYPQVRNIEEIRNRSFPLRLKTGSQEDQWQEDIKDDKQSTERNRKKRRGEKCVGEGVLMGGDGIRCISHFSTFKSVSQ